MFASVIPYRLDSKAGCLRSFWNFSVIQQQCRTHSADVQWLSDPCVCLTYRRLTPHYWWHQICQKLKLVDPRVSQRCETLHTNNPTPRHVPQILSRAFLFALNHMLVWCHRGVNGGWWAHQCRERSGHTVVFHQSMWNSSWYPRHSTAMLPAMWPSAGMCWINAAQPFEGYSHLRNVTGLLLHNMSVEMYSRLHRWGQTMIKLFL